MSFLDRLKDVTPCDPNGHIRFEADNATVGMMTSEFAQILGRFPDTFLVRADHVTLSPELHNHGERTRAVSRVLLNLREQGLIHGWRDELYPVSTGFD